MGARMRCVCMAALVAGVAAAPAMAGGLDPVPICFLGDGIANDVGIADELAYVASGWGLTIWDISGSTPQYVGGCDTSGFAVAVAVSGQYAFVGTTSLFFMTLEAVGGMEVIDISDPARSVQVGACSIPPMYPGQMAVSGSGDAVYITDAAVGVRVIDVSDPSQPAPVGVYEDPTISDISASGDYAFVTCGSGLVVLDMSDPTMPQAVATGEGTEGAWSVDLTGQLAVISKSPGDVLDVVDISKPAEPAVVGTYPGGGNTDWIWVAAAGDMAYVLQGQSTLLSISIAHRTQPTLVGSASLSQAAVAVTASETRVCLIPLPFNWNWESVMTPVDVTDPANPVVLGSTPGTGQPSAVAVKEGYAFVLDGGGLNAVDVSDPRAPKFVGSTPDLVRGVVTLKAAGNYAYIATGGGGLSIVDVSDPGSPTIVPNTWLGTDVTDVAIVGDYAFTVCPSAWSIETIYASGAQIGQQAGGCPFVNNGQGIAGEGTHLYVTAHGGGFYVFDISDPLHPVPVGQGTITAWDSHSLVVSGGYAYVAGYTDGLVIVHISDPAAPRQVAAVPARKAVWEVAVEGRYAYLADDEMGIRVIDISTPETPVEVGSFQTRGAAMGVSVGGQWIYVADYGWGLDVLHTLPVFTDVADSCWAYGEIVACYRAGIVSGYPEGTYGPANPITRDQMAAYISRALAGGDDNVPPDSAYPVPSFIDVPADHWAHNYIEYAAENNVVQGYEGGSYQPAVSVTRDQMAVYVARSMVAPSGEAGLADYVPSDPRNSPDVPDTFWAYKHVEYCVENGVVNGYDDGFYHPEIVVTRDQMAVCIARAFGLPL
jgi:hypothetical protein